MIKIPYRKIAGSGPARPYLIFELKNQENDTAEFAGLVDSGADFCLFPAQIADFMGIDRRKLTKKSVRGIGGSKPYVTHSIHLSILGQEIKVDAAFIEDNDSPILLGRSGFFEHFIVEFREAEKIFRLARAT